MDCGANEPEPEEHESEGENIFHDLLPSGKEYKTMARKPLSTRTILKTSEKTTSTDMSTGATTDMSTRALQECHHNENKRHMVEHFCPTRQSLNPTVTQRQQRFKEEFSTFQIQLSRGVSATQMQ